MCKISIRRRTAPVPGWRTWIAALAAISSGSVATAAVTVLDFEDIPAPQPVLINAQYGARGVLFPVAYLDKDPNAHSGTQVLRSNTFAAEFPSDPLVMTFTSRQRRVHFWASSHLVTANGTLTGFDAAGNVVATDGPRPVTQDVFTTEFQIKVNSPTIVRAEYQLDQMTVKSIDDLEFEGEAPPPPPKKRPVVKITSPPNGADLDLSTIDLAGTVTGAGLLSPVNVVVESLQQAGLNDQPLQIALTGSGTTKHFLQSAFGVVPLGPVTVKVTAQNSGALTGTATSTFTNLPAGIRIRFAAEGGTAVLGAFRFGIYGEGCKIAVYDHAAISVDGTGTTHIIRDPILTKWIAVNLGCPLSDEGDDPTGTGTRIQDFTGGRIYRNLPTNPSATAYVPAVFLDAIQKRGGDAVVGVPLADPSSSGGSITHLFQQFARPAQTELPSTLEIRGFPPVLWMERQLGGWFHEALAPTSVDQALHRSAATLWESFPCSSPHGPCMVADEPPFPPHNTPNAGDLFCNGTTYIPGLEGSQLAGSLGLIIPPEWVGIRGNVAATPVFGAIVSAHMTDIDNGLTHETHNGNCPGFPNILQVISTVTCVSDYEFFVRPIGPQVDTSPLPSLFGKSNVDEIKTEYEVAYASDAHNFLGAPTTGDLVHMTGRWIIDCGHASYKSELHPLFSFATMKTVISETNSFTGLEDILFGGKQATRVAIWINGWYPGGDNNAIEFDIFPPPRPSPDAELIVVKPLDFGPGGYTSAQDVTPEYSLEPPTAASHVHLRFTSPGRETVVTSAGEMMFQAGRQYWGKWYLYWGQ